MAIYGYCPRWEDFYLVVCDVCGRALKPQALKQHIGLFFVSCFLFVCFFVCFFKLFLSVCSSSSIFLFLFFFTFIIIEGVL